MTPHSPTQDGTGHAPTQNGTGQAFPKQFRLLGRGEFQRVYEEGQRRSAPLCTIFFRANGLAHSRLGITAPTRLGNAVLRNRIKRRLREFFRLNRQAIATGWDIVVNPRPPVATVPFANLVRDLLRIFPSQPAVAGHPPTAPDPAGRDRKPASSGPKSAKE